jgi:hypothetical protein
MTKPKPQDIENAFKLSAMIDGVCHPRNFEDPTMGEDHGFFDEDDSTDMSDFYLEVKKLSENLPQVILACDTLLTNCADPDAKILEFKPELAAAPCMLEALENLENDDGSIPDHAWKLVQDAISKAKGESE